MLTILLLTISNVFMTFAWYGHLKHKESPLFLAILVSWLIAFLEYCFQVPANRWGSAQFSAVQLKVIQEIITLIVFSVFAVWYLDAKLGWNHLAAFLLIGSTTLVNFAPINPYLAAILKLWQQGHFLNLNGLTRLVSALWPFVALIYVFTLMAARPGRSA